MLRSLTARYKGNWHTYSIEQWAELKGWTTRYILQRKRAGYSDDETINVPYGESPAAKTVIEKDRINIQQPWKQFVFAGTGQEHYTQMRAG